MVRSRKIAQEGRSERTEKWIGLLVIFGLLQGACQPKKDVEGESAHQARGTFKVSPQGDTPRVIVEIPQLEGHLTIRLPELISDTNRRLVYSETNLTHGVEWHRQPDGTLTSHWQKEGLAAYELTVKPEADGLLLKWTISNLGSDVWTDSEGTVCLQSHDVPSLYDPSAARLFLRGNGRWVRVRDTWKHEGGNWYLPPQTEPLNIMRRYIDDGSWKVSDFHPDEAIMAVTSRDGHWVLAQAWHQARYLLANVHERPKYACTDVCSYLGDVLPGETVRVHGKIYFFRGSLGDLESKYRADLQSKKIGLRRE